MVTNGGEVKELGEPSVAGFALGWSRKAFKEALDVEDGRWLSNQPRGRRKPSGHRDQQVQRLGRSRIGCEMMRELEHRSSSPSETFTFHRSSQHLGYNPMRNLQPELAS